MWSTPDIVLALFAIGGASATILMYLAAAASTASKTEAQRGRAYGQIPLSRRYAREDALRQSRATN